MKTAAIHSRIEPEIKAEAEGVLRKIGLSPTEAIRLFYTQIVLHRGLPFQVRVPNELTIEALKESRTSKTLESFETTDKLFASWDK